MYACGVDTKELINQIDERIDRGISIDCVTLGLLLGVPLDKCYDSVVWNTLGRLIWYMEHNNDEVPNETMESFQKLVSYAEESSADQIIEDNQDHFTYDEITYPAHYAGNNKITCKDALNSMMYPLEAAITPKVGYWLGCAFKYLWRAFLKGDPEKDLKKCKQCINEMLNLM